MAPSVAVVLAHFNGEEFIEEQLWSICNQTYKNLTLFIFDDASETQSFAFLESIAKQLPITVRIVRRLFNVGHVENFLRGLAEIDEAFDYYCFADQDDIWFPDKIERAINLLSVEKHTAPALYVSATILCGSNGETSTRKSSQVSLEPSFSHALVQNIGGGNTMVFNFAARNLVVAFVERLDVPVHDWWVYILVSGAGGRVLFDQRPSLHYRQHFGNLIGANHGFCSALRRLVRMLRGDYRRWNQSHCAALQSNIAKLSREHQALLQTFKAMRERSLWVRVKIFLFSDFRRRGVMGNFGLLLAIILKRV